MRVIKFILSSVLAILLLFGVIFLLFREVMLLAATSQIKGSLKTLRQIERDPTKYYYECRDKGGDEEDAVPEIFQLRFINDTDYQSEVICRQFPLDPIIIDSKKLPMFASKIKGSSGLIWGEAESSLGIEVLGRRSSVIVKEEKIDILSYRQEIGVVPVASCGGFGYTCCQEETAIGIGEQLFEVSDCPRSCFDHCQSRPVVLSFTSDPFYETKTKTVSIKSGTKVSFAYVIDAGDEELKTARISFGDGEEYDFSDLIGRVVHQYTCDKSSCVYEAAITAVDLKSTVSADTSLTKITVRVASD